MTSATIRTARLCLPIVGSFAGGSLYGWSGFAPAVRASFHVSHAQTSMVFSVALVSFTFGVLFGPTVFARLPVARRLASIAGLAVLCLFLAGVSPTFALFVLGYGLGFGFASGALYNHAISHMSQSGRPNLLVPITVAAFGLGGAAFGAGSIWLTQLGFGVWSHAPALVCLVAVVAVSLALGPSDEVGQTKGGPLFPRFPGRDILRLWVIFACGSVPGLIIMGMAVEFLPPGSDAVMLAGLAVVLAATGNTAGRLAAGVIAPLYGPARGIVLSLILSSLSLVALLLSTAPVAVLTALLLVALAYGHLAAHMPLLVKSRVSAQAFSTAFGWVFTGWGFAGLVGPWGAGWLFDQTGDFTITLGICLCSVILGLGLMRQSITPTTPGKPNATSAHPEG